MLWPLLAIAATIAEVVASVHHEGDVARLHAAGQFVESASLRAPKDTTVSGLEA